MGDEWGHPAPPAGLSAVIKKHWEDLTAQLASSSAPAASQASRGAPLEDGLRLGRARSALLATLLADLFTGAQAKLDSISPVALAAVGSFGRGAVALRSDVDVRLVVRGGSKSRESAARLADA
ncbi:MAG: hypothetical protein KF901_27870, partial [Myxococcales bacterium]|nr:hypothetical protein [Myxococcales bacterium]